MQKVLLPQWARKHEQIFRFLVAGGTAFAVNIIVLYIFTDMLGIYYLISTVWAFLISFGVSFLLQKFWTFHDGSRNTLHIQLPLYLGMQVMNLGLNAVLMYAFVEYFHLWYILSQVIIALALAFVSFFINKRYIFKTGAPSSSLIAH